MNESQGFVQKSLQIEKSLTQQRDADLFILSKMDDHSLLTFCKSSKYGNQLCQNDDFWRNRFIKKYGHANKNLENTRTWKDFYLLITYYLDLYTPNKAVEVAAERGGRKSNNLDIIRFFISRYPIDLDRGMYGAAKGGNKSLVAFFIDQGANQWNIAMRGAASSKSSNAEELVHFLIDQGADDWDRGLRGAAEANNMKLINFFIGRGANDWDSGLIGAAEGNHKQLIEYFIGKGATDWNWGLQGAASSGNVDLVNYFLRKPGFKIITSALNVAVFHGQFEVVEFLLKDSPEQLFILQTLLSPAQTGGYKRMIEYIQQKIKELE